MKETDILQRVVNIHNCLAQVTVNGDSAILMGEALKMLRTMAKELQNDIVENESGQENQ